MRERPGVDEGEILDGERDGRERWAVRHLLAVVTEVSAQGMGLQSVQATSATVARPSACSPSRRRCRARAGEWSCLAWSWC